MSKYAGTKTEANRAAAFAGESQARNQYTFFASVAKKEGYEQMAALFLKTAENEKEHAKLWLKELSGIGDTKANLAAAAARRKLRMDGYVSGLCQDCRGRGLPGAGTALPPRRGDRKAPRRALPRTAAQSGDSAGVRKERSQGLGMPQLRPHRCRHKGPRGLSRLQSPAELF